MTIQIKDVEKLKEIQEYYRFNKPTHAIAHIIQTYDVMIKENNQLLNDNMALRILLKNRKSL